MFCCLAWPVSAFAGNFAGSRTVEHVSVINRLTVDRLGSPEIGIARAPVPPEAHVAGRDTRCGGQLGEILLPEVASVDGTKPGDGLSYWW